MTVAIQMKLKGVRPSVKGENIAVDLSAEPCGTDESQWARFGTEEAGFR